MTYSPAEMADRMEIQDVLIRYAWAIDSQDWELFDTVFTPDAHLDYTANPGGVAGTLTEVKQWLMQSLLAFPSSQHLLSNTEIVLDGDRAAARTQMTNPMGARTRTNALHWFFIGGSYHDELVRTTDGWKICKRVERTTWFQGNLPPELVFE